jgi:hypothetical protein
MFLTVQYIRKTRIWDKTTIHNLGENYKESPILLNRKSKVNLLNPDNVLQQKSPYPDA